MELFLLAAQHSSERPFRCVCRRHFGCTSPLYTWGSPPRGLSMLLICLWNRTVLGPTSSVLNPLSLSLPPSDELPLLLGLLTAILSAVGPHDLANAAEPPAARPQAAAGVAPTASAATGGAEARAPASKADQMLSVRRRYHDKDTSPPPRIPLSSASRLGPPPPSQESLRQRRLLVAQALAQGPRVHSRSRGTFMRTHEDNAARAVREGPEE